MKLYLLTLYSFLTYTILWGQTVDTGVPYIVSGKLSPTTKFISISTENNFTEIERILKEEKNSFEKIYRFGLEKEVNISFFEEAEKTNLPSGNTVYQLGVESKGAVSLSFIFNKFKLDKNSFLYLIDPKSKKFIGAYSALNNNKENALGTELIMNDRVILELHHNTKNLIECELNIVNVIHGFRDLNKIAKGLNNSGSCQIDVNCPLGKSWENQRNSVAMMVNGGGFCTGTLVHNTSGNELPYFLSARHCGTNPTTWVFRFRYETPEGQTDCGTSNPSSDGPTSMSINGATLCANYAASDFTLSLLNFTPDPSWGIYYSGWDRRDIAPTICTGIHHPSGDVKKISQDSSTAIPSSFNNILPNSHWKVPSWDFGSTEPGSSGSPLFNEKHRVIGQLQGGNSHCGAPTNEMNDDYGKFAISWDGGGTNDSRLSNWLDPNNIGSLYIDGYDPLSSSLNKDVSISSNDMQFTTVCGDSLKPLISILNNGLDTLFNITIHYGYDGDYSNIYNWSDTIITFQTIEIELNDTTLSDGVHIFNAYADLGLITDENTSNDTTIFEFLINKKGTPIFLNLSIPCYASENTWSISSNNITIIQGGPYSDALSLPIIDSFCLEPICYTFKLNDSFGDGITSSGCENGSLKLTRNDGSILIQLEQKNANFGSSFTSNFCASIEKINNELGLKIYPNPASSKLSIDSQNDTIIEYKIYSSVGKLIKYESVNKTSKDVEINEIANGLYLIEVQTKNNHFIREIIIYQ